MRTDLQGSSDQRLIGLLLIGLLMAIGTVFAVGFAIRLVLTPRNVTPVLGIESSHVEMIGISCGQRYRIPPRVIRDYEATSPHAIEAIAAQLHAARSYSPSHPRCGNHCIVTLHTADASLPFVVDYNCRDPENEALIGFWSNVDWGVHLATYRSEGLGKAVSQAIIDSIDTRRVH